MITKVVVTKNYCDIEEAREKGLPEPEIDEGWSKAWFHFDDIKIAQENTTEGNWERCIHVTLDDGKEFMIPDTKEIREKLDKKFKE